MRQRSLLRILDRNNFYFAQNKNYYDQPSPVNAIISFNLKTSGHVNYDGDVISSQATKRIIITIENGIIKINSNGAALKGKLTFYPANLEFFLYTPFLYFPDSYPHLRVALISF